MKPWFTDSSLLRKFFIVMTAVVVLISLVWAALGWLTLQAYETSARVRYEASQVSVYAFEAETHKQDFLLHSLTDPKFYETGTTEHIALERAAFDNLSKSLDFLAREATPEGRRKTEELRGLVGAHRNLFSQLVAAFRERGFKDWGIEGNWREAIHQFEAICEQAKDLETDRDMLQSVSRRSE